MKYFTLFCSIVCAQISLADIYVSLENTLNGGYASPIHAHSQTNIRLLGLEAHKAYWCTLSTERPTSLVDMVEETMPAHLVGNIHRKEQHHINFSITPTPLNASAHITTTVQNPSDTPDILKLHCLELEIDESAAASSSQAPTSNLATDLDNIHMITEGRALFALNSYDVQHAISPVDIEKKYIVAPRQAFCLELQSPWINMHYACVVKTNIYAVDSSFTEMGENIASPKFIVRKTNGGRGINMYTVGHGSRYLGEIAYQWSFENQSDKAEILTVKCKASPRFSTTDRDDSFINKLFNISGVKDHADVFATTNLYGTNSQTFLVEFLNGHYIHAFNGEATSDYLTIPLNLGQTHFASAVVQRRANLKSPLVYYFDGSGQGNQAKISTLKAVFAKTGYSEAEFRDVSPKRGSASAQRSGDGPICPTYATMGAVEIVKQLRAGKDVRQVDIPSARVKKVHSGNAAQMIKIVDEN